MTSQPSSRPLGHGGARFPRWSFASAVALTLLTIAGFAVRSWRSYRVVQEFERRELAIERVCGQIVHLDEVLTMSARMCAATGDPEWERRYRRHVDRLDGAIEAAHELAPGATESESTQQTAAANQWLVAMELQAFDLVRDGRAAEAGALLASEEYEQQKLIYSEGTDRYLRAMRGRVAVVLARERDRARGDELILSVAVPLLVILWTIVAVSIRTHVRLRRESEARLREHVLALERSNREVRAAVRAKSEFFARMSHEIRTPMSGVLGVSEILSATRLDPDQSDLVKTIRGSGTLLLSLVDDILDFSKLEAGMLRVQPVPTNPRRVVEEVVQILQVKAQAKKIELVSRIAPEAPKSVLLDPTRLRQILMNVAGNAVKFTEHGGVQVELDAEPDGPDGWKLRFTIRDSGVGIPADRLAGIFEQFVQGDEAVSRRFGGTGLGLAISRELARLMGGTIEVESEAGIGSTFTIALPAPAAASRDEAVESSAGRPNARWSASVLVAEDNAINRIVAERMLAKTGCRVHVVTNGEECLRALERDPFDLVFMDCHMPVMDGLAATRAIREREGNEGHTPIVALTASAFPGDVEACRQAGMDDFVSKPVTAAKLADVLQRWLGARGESTAA